MNIDITDAANADMFATACLDALDLPAMFMQSAGEICDICLFVPLSPYDHSACALTMPCRRSACFQAGSILPNKSLFHSISRSHKLTP